MSAANEQPKRTIDERLEAITQTLEVVSHMQQTSEERIERLEKLAETNEKRWGANEKRWDRLARAIQAGLEEYFSDNGDGEGNGQ